MIVFTNNQPARPEQPELFCVVHLKGKEKDQFQGRYVMNKTEGHSAGYSSRLGCGTEIVKEALCCVCNLH
jgi:hypothetical protein